MTLYVEIETGDTMGMKIVETFLTAQPYSKNLNYHSFKNDPGGEKWCLQRKNDWELWSRNLILLEPVGLSCI